MYEISSGTLKSFWRVFQGQGGRVFKSFFSQLSANTIMCEDSYAVQTDIETCLDSDDRVQCVISSLKPPGVLGNRRGGDGCL